GVGTLEEVIRAPLGRDDRAGRALDVAQLGIAEHRPGAVAELMVEVDAAGVGGGVERSLERRGREVAVDRGQDAAHDRLAAAPFAAGARGEIVGERLDRELRVGKPGDAVLRFLILRHRLDHADRPAGYLPRELAGAENGGRGRDIACIRWRRERRLPPDAAAVEDHTAARPVSAEGEDLAPLDEER